MSLEAALQRLWYGPGWASLPLWPLALLFRALVALRRVLYRVGLLRAQRVAVPVVVVGNLTVGGTGKTPVAAWLAAQLAARGRRVGIVLRGYGGGDAREARVVTRESTAADVGDEALLHVRRRPHVVVVGRDRVAAARLAAVEGAEIVVCDDGLQHLRLARDLDVVVVDAVRGFGNGWLLPAGPLREPAVRLRSADAVVLTDRGNAPVRAQVPPGPLVAVAHFATGMAVRLRDSVRRPLAELRGRRIAAVAGIGQPAAFFAALRAAGLEIDEYPLGDHAALEAGRLPFAPDATVLMTEKDAVKCGGIAGEDWWYAELEVRLEPGEGRALVDLVLGHTAWADAGENRG